LGIGNREVEVFVRRAGFFNAPSYDLENKSGGNGKKGIIIQISGDGVHLNRTMLMTPAN
jgi:hypothetical protein